MTWNLNLWLITVCLFTTCLTTAFAEDLTRRHRAIGEDVVEGVDYLVKRSKIFQNDFFFVTRVAYVESLFGADGNTFRPGYYGGLWQISDSLFRSINPSAPEIQNVSQHFNINWASTPWNNCETPIYSGLALHLFLTGMPPIPKSIPDQAIYWKTHINPNGSLNTFIERADQLEASKTAQCSRTKLDVSIILDGSGSVGAANFAKSRTFISNLIKSFDYTTTRMGFLVYSTSVTQVFPVNHNLTEAQLDSAVLGAAYPAGGTNTHLAIQSAITQLSVNVSDGIPRIMFVFTDGLSNSPQATRDAANQAVAAGIISFGIGIGAGVDQSELLAIAGGDRHRVINVQDFDLLLEIISVLTKETCRVPLKPGWDVVVTDTLLKDEVRYFIYDMAPEGISVDLWGVRGQVGGFGSRNITLPSEALYDKAVSGWTYFDPGQNEELYVSIKGKAVNSTYTIKAYKGR